MQFLRLLFVKKLQLRPLTPTRGLLRPPEPHFSADFSILNSHAWLSCCTVDLHSSGEDRRKKLSGSLSSSVVVRT